MKRCNNCGWFNLDSASICEKCEDSSFEIVEEPEVKEYVVNVDLEPVDEKVVEKTTPMAATVAFSAQDVPIPAASEKRKVMSATIMDASVFVPEPALANSPTSCPKCCYPVSGEVDYCPNCGATIRKPAMPVSKSKPEQVPTHASESDSFSKATVIAAAPALEKATVATVMKSSEDVPEVPQYSKTVPIGQNFDVLESKPSSMLKATVADIDPSLLSDDSDCCRLVPVDSLGESEIILRPGEDVVIFGKKYRFEK